MPTIIINKRNKFEASAFSMSPFEAWKWIVCYFYWVYRYALFVVGVITHNSGSFGYMQCLLCPPKNEILYDRRNETWKIRLPNNGNKIQATNNFSADLRWYCEVNSYVFRCCSLPFSFLSVVFIVCSLHPRTHSTVLFQAWDSVWHHISYTDRSLILRIMFLYCCWFFFGFICVFY